MLQIRYKNCLLVIFVVLASFVSSFGQIELGVRSGFFFAKFRYFADDEHFADSKTINGAELGIIANFPIKKGFSFQPEINFVQKGGKLVPPSNPSTTTMNQIEISPTIKYEFKIKKISLFVGSGIFYGHFLNGKTKNLIGETKLKFDNWHLKRPDIGVFVGGGVGFTIGRGQLFLESRYRHSILYTADADLEDGSLSIKNSGVGVFTGYKIKF